MVCGARDASPEALRALSELARAAIRAENVRRAALPIAERVAEDARRREGRARLDRIRRRAALDEHGGTCGAETFHTGTGLVGRCTREPDHDGDCAVGGRW